MKNLNEQIDRIKTLMLISEQCGGDLSQCEDDLQNSGYKVFNPTEIETNCESNEVIKCVKDASNTMGVAGRMNIGSIGESVSDCYVLLKSAFRISGVPLFHFSFYADEQVVVSVRLGAKNDNKKLLYRGLFECSGGNINIKGGKSFKFIGVSDGSGGSNFENKEWLDGSGSEVVINTTDAATYGIAVGKLKYADYFAYQVNVEPSINITGNPLSNGLTQSQIKEILTFT